jgi:hypothetical protein
VNPVVDLLLCRACGSTPDALPNQLSGRLGTGAGSEDVYELARERESRHIGTLGTSHPYRKLVRIGRPLVASTFRGRRGHGRGWTSLSPNRHATNPDRWLVPVAHSPDRRGFTSMVSVQHRARGQSSKTFGCFLAKRAARSNGGCQIPIPVQ